MMRTFLREEIGVDAQLRCSDAACLGWADLPLRYRVAVMTMFSRTDTQPMFDRRTPARAPSAAPGDRSRSLRAIADFVEELGILFRYAAGRDYYDRRLLIPKD